MKKQLPSCLFGAGWLGHTWLVTYINADGVEFLRCQCSDGPYAHKCWSEETDQSGRIFTRVIKRGKKTWKEVAPAAAMIA